MVGTVETSHVSLTKIETDTSPVLSKVHARKHSKRDKKERDIKKLREKTK